MINQEVFGGLVSALSRGESLQKAMFSLFNAGYLKKDIEDAAMMLQSQTPVQIAQKQAIIKKQIETGKVPLAKEEVKKVQIPIKVETKKEEAGVKKEELIKPEKKMKYKQIASKYGVEKNQEEFGEVIDETIKNLEDIKSPMKIIKSDSDFKPPIIIQKISEYDYNPKKKTGKAIIVILFILLALLLGALATLFLFKDKIIEVFNNFGF